jgi:CheY-like chemotaxis protein/HPt (histidine-containing phosphotransfer) domain-containing protein
VVEDNLINQKVIVRILANQGHEATVASNGQEALMLLKSGSFELVFMDVQMPVMDGLTATRKIREMEKEKKLGHIPIVAMTAHAMEGHKQTCLAAGMDHYLSKPAGGETIKAVLAKIFDAESRNGRALVEAFDDSPHWNSGDTLKRLGGDESLLTELAKIFVEVSPGHLEKLGRALHSADADAVERLAHAFKGELDCLGLTKAADLARDIESLGRRSQLRPAKELFEAFTEEVCAATTSMRHFIASHKETTVEPTNYREEAVL